MRATLWYLVYVSMKPLPYVAAGVIGGWLATALDEFTNDTEAIAIVVVMSMGASLIVLPTLLALYRHASAASEGADLSWARILAPCAGGVLLVAALAWMIVATSRSG